jgi:hypothetical protein
MRTAMLVILGICSFGSSAKSQLLLNAGDSYSAQFTFSSATTELGISPRCVSSYALFSLWSNASVQLELFENSVNEPPIGIQVSGNGGVSYLSCPSPFWADHQGAVRVSVLSGAVRLDGVVFSLQEPIGMKRYLDYGASITPVPEPSIIAMLACASLLFTWRISKRRWKIYAST